MSRPGENKRRLQEARFQRVATPFRCPQHQHCAPKRDRHVTDAHGDTLRISGSILPRSYGVLALLFRWLLYATTMDVFSAILTPSTTNELIAGSFAGAAQVIVGQPLDTIKTRAQIAPSMSPPYIQFSMGCNHICRGHVCMYSEENLLPTHHSRLMLVLQKGPMDILVQTVRKEGFFALYKGIVSPCRWGRSLRIDIVKGWLPL